MTYNDVISVSHQEFLPKIQDLLAVRNGLWYKLAQQKFKKGQGGNNIIQWALNVNENPAQGFIDGTTDVLDTNLSTNLTYAQLNYKFFYSNSNYSFFDQILTDNSPNAIISMVQEKTAAAYNTMIRTLSAALFTSGTTANRSINGMADVFAASGTAYAGVNNSTYANWYPVVDTTTNLINFNNIQKMLGTLSERTGQSPYNNAFDGNYSTNLMISRSAVQTAYISQMQIQQRFMDSDVLKSGMKGIEVDGIPWVIDFNSPGTDGTPDNYLYLLCTDGFEFRTLAGFGSDIKSPFDGVRDLPNQPIKVHTSMHAGNLICKDRRVQGVFKALQV